ncbi:hypothetical protein BH11BAC7_BH11BAC7_14010 [soil metagenome]
MSMKIFLPFAFLFIFSSIRAQNISTHIPKSSTYIVTLNPSTHVNNGDLKSVDGLELFSRSSEYGNDFSYIYGDQDLSVERQRSFGQLFVDIFSDPKITGIDTTRKIFIFNQATDSIHYWAYVLPISNASDFGIYLSTHLFSDKPEIQKGSGYSEINEEKISIGWTTTYAVILLADFDYVPDAGNVFSQAVMDSLFVADEERAADAMRIADSTAVAQMYKMSTNSVISDSLRQARIINLMMEQQNMLNRLANDSTPEEFYNREDEYAPYAYSYSDHIRDSGIAVLARKQVQFLVNLNYEESIESVANFRKVDAEKSDVVYWYNYGEMMQQYYERNMKYRYEYYSTSPENDTARFTNMWLGSYIVSVVHFEGNVATMEQRSYFSPVMQEYTKGLYTGRVDKKMFRYVKGENLMGYVAMSMNMEKFMKFYGNVYRESVSNSYAGFYSKYYMMMWDLLRVFLDEKTMYNIFDGQFLFAVTDLKPYTSSYLTYDYDENFERTEIRKERTEVRPEFVMVAGIGKPDKAKEILAILERSGALKKQNNNYYLINSPGEYDIKMFLALRNGMLIITNNEDLMVHHLKKGYSGGQAMKKEQRKLGRKSALIGWWDGQKSFELVKKNYQEPLSDEDKKALDLLQQDINSGVVIGRKAKNGVQRVDVKIELNDPQPGSKQSSFVRFFKLLNSLYLIRGR